MLSKKKYTEQEIVAGCVRNERRFQELLYKEHFRTMMYMCLRHTQDEGIAMEIVNSGFLRVFQKLHTFEFKGSLQGWIRRIVFHALSDYFRQNAKHLQFIVLEERDDAIAQDALSNMYLEDIYKMIDVLPPATKQVFQFYAIEGYSHKEIGEKMNISEGTSKWHLNAARKKLKELINQNNQFQRHA